MVKAKQLVTDGQGIVDEMLEGMVRAHPHLALLRDERVVVHRDFESIKQQQVTLVSGGGSGHEPAHAGYVGSGMLTAAVCGGVFASPSTQQVLAAIRKVAGPHGTVVIVKNYTGDRLNFGLAVEEAKAEGYKVDMIIIGEDVAVVNANAGRRGLSGTVFAHKLAGAAAHQGASLKEIIAMLEKVTKPETLGTMGVAIKPCTLPGQDDQSRDFGDNEMELGLGIHGEPGMEKAGMEQVPALTQRIINKILDNQSPVHVQVTKGDKCVLMINNLGSTTNMELYVVAKYAVQALEKQGVIVERVLVGAYMTSLDMAGFSLTIWHSDSDQKLLGFLDHPASAPGWNYVAAPQRTEEEYILEADGASKTSTKAFSRPSQLSETGSLLERCISSACEALVKAEPDLTAWDYKVGDGDCGTTFKEAAQMIQSDMADHYPLNDPADTLRAIAVSLGKSAGGTSGVLYNIFFTTAAGAIEQGGDADAQAWTKCFQAGTDAIKRYGGASEGSRTMLDALLPAGRAVFNGSNGAEMANAAAKAAEEGAEKTKDISTTKAFGRSGYVGEDHGKDVPDPGAKAAACWISAVAKQLQ